MLTQDGRIARALIGEDSDIDKEYLVRVAYGDITTEIVFPAPAFYYAEDYHQQYLSKNPNGYCGLGGTGVSCAL